MIAGCAIGGVVGGLVGVLVGEGAAYRRQFHHERDLIAPVLASDPAFAKVEIHEYSGGGAWLSGTVPSAGDRERLRVKLIQVLGEPKTKFLLNAVEVERGANAVPPP